MNAATVFRDPMMTLALERLRGAVLEGEEQECTRALACVLEALGSETEGRMGARKAWRAFGFKFEDEQRVVTYTIDLHPGSSWLTHRHETRAVNLTTGHESLVSDDFAELSLADVIERAQRLALRSRLTPAACASYAASAIEYERELTHRHGWGRDSSFDAAVGWMALIATSHRLPAAWPGRVKHMREALEQRCWERQHAQKYAAAVVHWATGLWPRVVAAHREAKR